MGTENRHLTYATDEDGRMWAIPAGGSGEPPPDTSGGEGAGEGGQTQSTDTGTASEGGGQGQSQGGQGFIEPYLKDIPEDQRPVVEPVLERFRQDQDAQVNRKIEQIREEARIPTTIYQSLLQDPEGTLNWIADRMQEERGVDVRAKLRDQWYGNQQVQSGQEGDPQSGQGQEDQPLTQADIDRILEEREQARNQEIQQQQIQQQQAQQQQKTVNNWVSDAAKSHDLELDDSQGEDPLRAVIIMQANALHESGQARGQAAIDMATEAVAKRFGVQSSGKGKGEQPRTANGGTPPPPPEYDVQDSKQRKDRMAELFIPPSTQ